MEKENDIFDEIVFAEERFQNEGFKQGVELGKQSGYLDGFGMGKEHGIRIGTEIGFYRGFLKGWTVVLEKEGTQRPKVTKVMNSLRELLDSFPLDDPQRPTIQSDVLRIRAKYKQLASLLNINLDTGPKENKTTSGISFREELQEREGNETDAKSSGSRCGVSSGV